MMEVLLRLAMQAHVMGGPERGELLASGRELADEVGEVAVERISSDLAAQGRDAFLRGSIPVGEELPGARVEIGEAGHVRGRPRFEHRRVEGSPEVVGGEYVLAAVDDERGGAGHRVDHPLDARAHSPPGRAAAPAGGPVSRGASQVEKMRPLRLVQTERARDRFEDALGNAGQAAALHPVVVVDTDPGQGRDLLAPQARDLPGSGGGETDLPGSDLRPPRCEEVPYLGLRVHVNDTNPD